MATSLLVRNSSMENKEGEEEIENQGLEEQDMRPETVKQRGRKSGKLLQQKKQPQRGLGVAQLERLRLQERWKRITEIDQVQFQPPQNHHHPFPFPFLDQNENAVSVPFQRLPPVDYGAMSAGQSSFGFQPYMQGNGVFLGGAGVRSVFPDQFELDQSRIVDQKARFKSVNLFETAKELSSIQRTHCLSDQCEICFKKKRINGENLGFNGGGDKYAEMNNCDFLGSNWTIDGEMNKASYFGLNVGKEVEVMAVHRKGKSAVRGGSVLMEYEFFPGSSSSNKDSSVAEATGRAVMGEASPANTNFLDLSLKLSC